MEKQKAWFPCVAPFQQSTHPAPIDKHSWEIAVWDAVFSSIIEVMRKWPLDRRTFVWRTLHSNCVFQRSIMQYWSDLFTGTIQCAHCPFARYLQWQINTDKACVAWFIHRMFKMIGIAVDSHHDVNSIKVTHDHLNRLWR